MGRGCHLKRTFCCCPSTKSCFSIPSDRLARKIAKRLAALATFPRLGAIDELIPIKGGTDEPRITYVAPYAIRYRYDSQHIEVRIDAITNERGDTPVCFL